MIDNEFNTDAVEAMLEEQPETVWFPETASQADWCIKKIAEAKATKKRLGELADEEIERINFKKAQNDEKYDQQISFFTEKLKHYFDSLPEEEMKITKTQVKYPLFNGTLVFTRPKQDYEHDDNALIEYYEETNYVCTERKLCWGELKKNLTIFGDHAIDKDTGEIVPGIKIVETEGKFEVKV